MNETSLLSQASDLHRGAGEGTIDTFSSTHFLYLNGNADTCKRVSPEDWGMWSYVVYLN